MKQTRRAFVTAVGSIAVGTGVSSGRKSTDVQSVAIYMDERRNGLGSRTNRVLRRAESPFEAPIDNYELSMGPAGTVSVPEHIDSDHKSAHSWWKSADERPDDQLSLLIVDGRETDWDLGGYADIGGPSGVVSLSNHDSFDDNAMLVAHEVTHLLGLHHRHGERLDENRVTIASDLGDGDEWAPTLSERSKRELR